MTSEPFTSAQQNYLQGFILGSDAARKVQGLPVLSNSAASAAAGTTLQIGPAGVSLRAESSVNGTAPSDLQGHAQQRILESGKKLCREEQAKREQDPLGLWAKLRSTAQQTQFPQGTDVFLWKYHGLFHVAPAQDSFMCRLRIAGGELKSWQLAGIADLAEQHGGGYVDATTRANLQIREIPADRGICVLEGLAELGLVNKGAGADNVRNITASATSGIDRRELIETLPLARALHHHILNHRELYGLPRKFNIAFDGGGGIATLEDANDVGFQAVSVPEECAGPEAPAGVYFRLMLGGITGHRDFARETGVLATPDECIDVADAILRVFIAHGDRTDRKRARLKYLLDDWGFDRFLSEVQRQLGRSLRRVPAESYSLPAPPDRWAHVGVHPQSQPDRCYLGVALPVGRITSEQARMLANLSERYGSGRVRLTVWQNLLIPDVHEADIEALQREIEEIGLDWRASSVRSGLVACTGAAGCKFAAADTKAQALQLAAWLEERVELDTPINIHLTGCPNSCAQHYIGDIGLRGTKVEVGEELVDGYEIVVGGGYADRQGIARQLIPQAAFEDIPPLIERLIQCYLAERRSGETFSDFARRSDLDYLRSIALPDLVAA